MTASTSKTKRRRHAGSANVSMVTKPTRHVARPTGATKDAADRDDTAHSAPLQRDVDSNEATQLDAIFEEPLHVDDDAIVDDPDSTGSRPR